MARNKIQRDPLPARFGSLADYVAFWDTHDITDYPDVWRETDIKVNLLKRTYSVPLNPKLAERLESVARTRKTTVRRLVQRWLEERLRAA